MNMQETLTAYLEGTLSPAERMTVLRQINNSTHWRNEFYRLQDVRRELQREMPLMGRPLDGQLAALLPNILDSKPRLDMGLIVKQIFMYTLLFLTIVALSAMFMQFTTSAHAAVQRLQNEPSITNTPEIAQSESTVEVQNQVLLVRAESGDNQALNILNNHASFTFLASPAPMPGATAIPSLEAE
jgi:hypothetical protein